MSMRVTFALVAAATLAPALVAAQAQPTRSGPEFGIVAGANLANISATGGSGDITTGLVAGVSARWRLAGPWSIQPELLYSQKGSKDSFDDPDFGPGSFKLRLDYIEAPIHVRYDIPARSTVKPFLLAGPYLGYRLGCDAKSEGVGIDCDGGSIDIGGGQTIDVDLGLKRFDYGLSAGGGIDFPLGGRTAMIGARYGLGLAKLASEGNARNRNIQLVLGLRF